jgi:hypothetical protein
MPMISSAHKTLVHYPDDTSRVITLHVRPLEADVLRQRHYTKFRTEPDTGGDERFCLLNRLAVRVR